jgi:hypothetical protein
MMDLERLEYLARQGDVEAQERLQRELRRRDHNEYIRAWLRGPSASLVLESDSFRQPSILLGSEVSIGRPAGRRGGHLYLRGEMRWRLGADVATYAWTEDRAASWIKNCGHWLKIKWPIDHLSIVDNRLLGLGRRRGLRFQPGNGKTWYILNMLSSRLAKWRRLAARCDPESPAYQARSEGGRESDLIEELSKRHNAADGIEDLIGAIIRCDPGLDLRERLRPPWIDEEHSIRLYSIHRWHSKWGKTHSPWMEDEHGP